MNVKPWRQLTTIQQDQALVRWGEIRLARLYFNGSCFLCGKSIITNRKRPKPHTKLSFVGFAYHHLVYRNGDPRRKNYPKSTIGTWQYKKAVLPFVEKYSTEFMLLDKGCHKLLESAILKTRRFDQFPSRLEQAIRLTKTERELIRGLTPKIINR